MAAIGTTFTQARTLLTPPPLAYWLDEVERLLGVQYTPEQRDALRIVPFSMETLRACVGTHLLFPSAPLSLVELRDLRPELFYGRKPEWYDEDAERSWAAARMDVRWHLLRKETAPGWLSKTFLEQQQLISDREGIPRACVVAFGLILHCLATGERLFSDLYVRCSDKDSVGDRVIVGSFDRGGLRVNAWDYDGVGLAISREVLTLPSGSIAAS